MFAFYKHWPESLKDFGIVVGIVAILFLELGFTTFISTTDLAEKSSDIVSNADCIISPLPVVENGIANTFYSADLVRHRNLDDSRPKKQYTVRAKPLRAATKVRRNAAPKTDILAKQHQPNSSAPAEPNDLSADIALQRQNVTAARKVVENRRETHDTQAAIIVKPRSEKRSFIASALPIIKKPYNWIKAIGSKLF